jgi:16S rRNA processing protein RimM
MTATEEWVWLAHIRRPQGRKGEVFAEILTDFPEKFTERRRLWLLPEAASGSRTAPAPREVELIAHWLHKGGLVLHFSGVDSITAAETLSDLIVAIPRAERALPTEDEVYVSDLIGCALVDVAGASEASAASLVVVRGAVGEVLVPFAKSFLRNIDLESKRVEMALPEGLTDLNAPGKS